MLLKLGYVTYPKYLKVIVFGSILYGRRVAMSLLLSSSISLYKKEEFSTLIDIPVAEQNISRAYLKSWHSSTIPSPNNITSSTKNK